jgi:hypothetical protein
MGVDLRREGATILAPVMEHFTSVAKVLLYHYAPKCLYHCQDKYPFAGGTVEAVPNLDEAFEHGGTRFCEGLRSEPLGKRKTVLGDPILRTAYGYVPRLRFASLIMLSHGTSTHSLYLVCILSHYSHYTPSITAIGPLNPRNRSKQFPLRSPFPPRFLLRVSP